MARRTDSLVIGLDETFCTVPRTTSVSPGCGASGETPPSSTVTGRPEGPAVGVPLAVGVGGGAADVVQTVGPPSRPTAAAAAGSARGPIPRRPPAAAGPGAPAGPRRA